ATVIFKTGDLAEQLYLMFEGKGQFYMDVNGKLVHYFTFENNSTSLGAGGLLPYSRMKSSPGYLYADGKVKCFALHKKYFPELEQLNPELIQRLVSVMTERARSFATQKLQHEKVNALGQLAAGIAHELNNPAAAINRISSELTKRLNRNYERTEKMLQSNITPQHLHYIRELLERKNIESSQKIKLGTDRK